MALTEELVARVAELQHKEIAALVFQVQEDQVLEGKVLMVEIAWHFLQQQQVLVVVVVQAV
jgi:hypothetical protein